MSLLRQAPSGPVIGGAGKGSIVQSAVATTTVSVGNVINTAREIKTDMSAVAAPSMRAELAGVNTSNLLRLETDFDVILGSSWTTGPLIVNVDVSDDDGATWTTIHNVQQTWPELITTADVNGSMRGHVHVTTLDTDVTAIDPGYLGGLVTSRVTLQTSAPDGFISVASEATNGSASLRIFEVTP